MSLTQVSRRGFLDTLEDTLGFSPKAGDLYHIGARWGDIQFI